MVGPHGDYEMFVGNRQATASGPPHSLKDGSVTQVVHRMSNVALPASHCSHLRNSRIACLHDGLGPEKIAQLLGVEGLLPHALDQSRHKGFRDTGKHVVKGCKGPHDVCDMLQGQLLQGQQAPTVTFQYPWSPSMFKANDNIAKAGWGPSTTSALFKVTMESLMHW